ncbi:MAG: ABC transporter ATP-binding protein [Lactobacillus sp.]
MNQKVNKLRLIATQINTLNPHMIASIVIAAILRSVIAFIQVVFLGQIVNLILYSGHRVQQLLFDTLWFLLVLFGLQLITACVATYAKKQANLLNTRAQTKLSQHLLKVDYATYTSKNFLQLYSDIKSGLEYTGGFQQFVTTVVNSSADFITNLLLSGGLLISLLVALDQKSDSAIGLALIIAGLVLLPIVISKLTGKYAGKWWEAFFKANIGLNRKLSYYLDYAFKNIPICKLLRFFDPQQTYVNQAATEILAGVDEDQRLQVKTAQVENFPIIVTSLVIGLLYLVIGLQAVKNQLAIGSVVACVGTLQLLINSLANLFSSWSSKDASLHVIAQYQKFMHLGITDTGQGKQIPYSFHHNFEIKIDHVYFKYPDQSKYALEDMTMTIKAGEIIALVGPNGSGKTTLVKLLLRLIAPQQGGIYLNGVNINAYDLASYRAFFSTLSQDFLIVADSLAENVAMGTTCSQPKVMQSLEAVNFTPSLKKLKHGIATPISTFLDASGVDLSGGEKQKVAIARTAYRKSTFYILDEPTAALDPISEDEVFNHLRNIVHHQTALFISHRMSSTRTCDTVYVLNHAKLVEHGTHEQLMAQKGLYFKLYRAQADYFKTAD